ncbi:hypothetical protein DDZ18_10780 [Marinicauda salina]|uniref:CDP-diacylglycerol--glycerol-3-phosphate 3-phosphatidyltransferase n=1 Tax=Marinicauda salina TaxID=2135793 RepID=A0A2U2BRP4_9PROT|nr:CDP-alcohol phosphatidyltransferase family protein [Marinicauda salina]PWE16687.1 hypothetical protein DDZ18_10780 [Marinicauda salina]
MTDAPSPLLRQLPNAVTVARAIAGLVGAWAFVRGGALVEGGADAAASNWAIAAGVIFVLAAASDYLDGWLARRFGAESPLGALMDPIADKILVDAYLVGFLAAFEFDPFLAVPVAIIILRDLLVTGLRLNGLSETDTPLAVTEEAKFKTGVVMILVALPFLLALLNITGWFYIWVGGVWFAALLSAWTGWPYLRAALKR